MMDFIMEYIMPIFIIFLMIMVILLVVLLFKEVPEYFTGNTSNHLLKIIILVLMICQTLIILLPHFIIQDVLQ